MRQNLVILILAVLIAVAFYTAFYTPMIALMLIYIPAGAAQYVHFTPIEIMIRYATLAYAAVVTIANLYIAIGLVLRKDKARILAIMLSPIPLIGTITSYPFGTLLMCTGISFPNLAYFILPILAQNPILSENISLWLSVINVVRTSFGILNLFILVFLTRKQVKSLFKKAKPQEPQHSTIDSHSSLDILSVTETPSFCSRCGQKIYFGDSKFCPYCGYRLK